MPEDSAAHTLRVFELPDEDGGESTWYASSEFTRGMMELHRVLASEAAQDVPDVIDAEPGEEPYGEPVDIDEEALEVLAP